MKVAGLILAGGEGRRLGGRDKALMALSGQPLLAHAIERFAPQVADLALSANGDLTRFSRFDLPILTDGAQGNGPLAGIAAGLAWAEALGADYLVTVAVDTPFFPGDLVPQLILAAEAGDTAVALASSAGHLHPTFGLWKTATRIAVDTALAAGRYKLREVAAKIGYREARFPDDKGDPFFNINTPSDLLRAEAMIAGDAR